MVCRQCYHRCCRVQQFITLATLWLLFSKNIDINMTWQCDECRFFDEFFPLLNSRLTNSGWFHYLVVLLSSVLVLSIRVKMVDYFACIFYLVYIFTVSISVIFRVYRFYFYLYLCTYVHECIFSFEKNSNTTNPFQKIGF